MLGSLHPYKRLRRNSWHLILDSSSFVYCTHLGSESGKETKEPAKLNIKVLMFKQTLDSQGLRETDDSNQKAWGVAESRDTGVNLPVY